MRESVRESLSAALPTSFRPTHRSFSLSHSSLPPSSSHSTSRQERERERKRVRERVYLQLSQPRLDPPTTVSAFLTPLHRHQDKREKEREEERTRERMLCFVILVLLGVSVVDGGSTGGSFVPALPAVPAEPIRGCQLDLSDEFFGGVAEACGQGPDRARCCPVLAAWLFAAHARSALVARPPPVGSEGLGSDGPVGPDDAQSCADSLQSELQRRKIALAKVNESCDLVLCYCGIRLHQIGSLSCPAGFNVSTAGGAAAPTAAVRRLERNCRNASYSGCSLCLRSLNSLGGRGGGAASETERAKKMFGRDCQLMGLTWLLSRNRTAYIATVSAVLRAMLYAPRPPRGSGAANPPPPYRCSADHDNMPLAVDSQRLEKRVTGAAAVPSAAAAISFATFLLLIGMFDYHFT